MVTTRQFQPTKRVGGALSKSEKMAVQAIPKTDATLFAGSQRPRWLLRTEITVDISEFSLGEARTRTGRSYGLDTDMVVDRSRPWIVRGQGQTAVVVVDWIRAWTDCGRGCGLDKAMATRPDDGADIPRLNRDHFADNRTLKMQGVRRPTCHPHKSCGHSRINMPARYCNTSGNIPTLCRDISDNSNALTGRS